jgi:RNA polymerase sigma-70 factor (ECF subfamily)
MRSAGSPEAAALVDRLARGDHQALAELYDRYAGIVNALALRILRRSADAEDVVQEVFVQVWRQAARFDASRGTPEAWLFTITRTRALDRLRRVVAAQAVSMTPPPVAAPVIEHGLAVRRALEELPPDQRAALELAYYEGLTQSEIAARLGQPLGTVKTRIRTAMIRLRETLEPLEP